MLTDHISFLPPAEVPVKSAVIMLHGYGSDGNDLITMAPLLAKGMKNTAFYAPNAPKKVDAGFKWFDFCIEEAPTVMERFMYIERLMKEASVVVPEIQDFILHIQKKHNLSSQRIVLMGFSQGGLLSLMSGLTYPERIGGIIACSSIPLAINTALPIETIVSKPVVLLTHGLADDVVPFVGEQITENTLKNIDVSVETHTVNGMGHEIDSSCLVAMEGFLRKVLS